MSCQLKSTLSRTSREILDRSKFCTKSVCPIFLASWFLHVYSSYDDEPKDPVRVLVRDCCDGFMLHASVHFVQKFHLYKIRSEISVQNAICCSLVPLLFKTPACIFNRLHFFSFLCFSVVIVICNLYFCFDLVLHTVYYIFVIKWPWSFILWPLENVISIPSLPRFDLKWMSPFFTLPFLYSSAF